MPKIILKDGITSQDLSNRVSGRLIGDGAIKIKGLAPLEQSKEGDLTFYNGKSVTALLKILETNTPSCILLSESVLELEENSRTSFIIHKDPYKAFLSLLPLFFKRDDVEYKIHPLAVIHKSSEIHPEVSIGAYSVIEEGVKIEKGTVIHAHVTIYPRVEIGENTEIHSGVTIREDVKIGKGCIIQNGAIIGADGFGYIPDPEKGLVAVPQIGIVELADYTEVGANSCIDRATLGSTRIGYGSKIDNLVQIGHNTQVGKFSIICGQAAIAGSTKIGNQVVIGGAVGIADHTEIADGCRFGGLSGLYGKYTEKADYMGNPAMKASDYRRMVASLKKLPELMKSLRKGD